MRNGMFKRALPFCSFHINVNPLVVERGIGKMVYLLLRYFVPVGYANFFTQVCFEFCMTFYHYHNAG